MVRRTIVASLAAFLAVAVCGVVPVAAPAAGAYQRAAQEEALAAPISSYADNELVDLLRSAELLDEWTDASSVAAEVALLAVADSPQYDVSRSELVADLERLIERRDHIEQRSATIDGLTEDVGVLQQLLRDLRRVVSAGSRDAALSLTETDAEAARRTLETVVGDPQWMGLSLDPVVFAEYRLVTTRDRLQREIDDLVGARRGRGKTPNGAIARLTEFQGDLERVGNLLANARQATIPSRLALAAERAEVVNEMAPLHERRLLLPTEVGGLPVVTLDAYVQGASLLDPSCPVEWNLLAGIGRIESFHGTIDGSQVQQSGRVSVAILGPLLDGGATEREAAAAAAAAEEAAQRELEELAEPEDEEPSVTEFDASVWGDDTLERAAEIEAAAAAGRQGVGRAAPPPVVEEVPRPRYDPLLWGDDLPFDEADLPESTDADAVDDELDEDEEPEFRGNGFAVIRDSDNGRLDGNSRWDRAVGPMQFLPETWSYWETDGNDDGVIDPQNLYDAAATAGQFLCHLSRTRGASPYSFVLGYNSSPTYVRNVMAVADAFGAVALPVGIAD